MNQTIKNLYEHPLVLYTDTLPKTLWGSLESRLSIINDDMTIKDVENYTLYIILNGIHAGREAIVLSVKPFGDNSVELHPTIANELRIKEIEALSDTPEGFLDKVFMSDGFKFLSRTAGVMFTRNVRPFSQRGK